MTNGRIVTIENIRQTKPLNIALMGNKEHFNSHVVGSTHTARTTEKNIFTEEAELIFYNEIGVQTEGERYCNSVKYLLKFEHEDNKRFITKYI